MQIPDSFSELTQAAFYTAKKAGDFLKKGYSSDFQISPKAMKNDVVTDCDYAAEKLIVDMLSKQFPTHSFLCEEGGQSPHTEGSIRWIIDPLDGTVNFAHGIPLFCVSIAACLGEEILAGAIYAPMTEEMFFAEVNGGAYLNGQRLKVSSQESLFSAYVGTSLSFNLHKDPTQSIALFSRLAHFGFPIRALGSTALNLGYIAAGKLDAYWSQSGSVNSWDAAAGKLLVEEAGGKVSQCNGSIYSLEQESTILASNGKLHDELIQYLTS